MPKVVKIKREIFDSASDVAHGFGRQVESIILDGGEAYLIVTLYGKTVHVFTQPPYMEDWKLGKYESLGEVELSEELIQRIWDFWSKRESLYGELFDGVLIDALNKV